MNRWTSTPYIRMLYSGFSDHIFMNRKIAVLQAYFDDSIKSVGRKRLFLAGFVNSGEKWIDFSNEWRAAMSDHPSIEYFKASEAQALRGQFRGWGRLDRELKVMKLARIIKRSEPWSFHVCLDLKSFESASSQDGIPFGFRTPYFLAVETIILKVAERHREVGVTSPVDFIFDEQSQIHRTVTSLWEHMKESQPEDIRPLLGGTPIFRSDKDIEALQAADMLVWHVQRETVDGVLSPKKPASKLLFRSNHHLYVNFTDEVLTRLSDGLNGKGDLAKIDTREKWRVVLDAIDSQGLHES